MERMTGAQSRLLKVGARVCWRDDKTDQGTVTDTNWSGVTLQWDSRSEQSILHNDMDAVALVSKNDGHEEFETKARVDGSQMPRV
jgi:hypothetical protein